MGVWGPQRRAPLPAPPVPPAAGKAMPVAKKPAAQRPKLSPAERERLEKRRALEKKLR